MLWSYGTSVKENTTLATNKPVDKYIPPKDDVIWFYKGIRHLQLVPWVYRMPDFGYIKNIKKKQ